MFTIEKKKLALNVLNEAGNPITADTKLQLLSKGQVIDISGKPTEEVVNLLESGNTYTVVGSRPGYFPQELVFSFKEDVADLSLKMQAIPYGLQVYDAIIYYDFDKDSLRELSKEKLDEITTYLTNHPELNLVIESHTDSRATVDYNEKLSERRAQSVTQYLEKKGISSSRISAKWYNEEKLVTPCGDGVPCPEADHQLNRRSELKLIAFPDPSQSYPLPKGASATDFQSREAATSWFKKIN
jgi:outer membrane protein OmpA-like peptidoglycan-associated protein